MDQPRGVAEFRNGHKPLGLLAELTHRCPLGCPYCSNPLAFDAREDELDSATWVRVFREAAGLGVLQVHLSGGEPGARRDLLDITTGAHAAGLYTNLITSAVGIMALGAGEEFAKERLHKDGRGARADRAGDRTPPAAGEISALAVSRVRRP